VYRQYTLPGEVIIVDDGSTDNGIDAITDILQPWVRIIKQNNQGVSAARNRGMNEARHSIVAYLDADDEWYPEYLNKQLYVYSKYHGIVAAFTNYLKTGSDNPVLMPYVGDGYVIKDYFNFCLHNRGRGMNSSNVVISRDALLSIGGFPVGRSSGEDLDTWVRLAIKGPIAYIPSVLMHYHDECGSTGRNVHNMDVMNSLRSYLKDNNVSKSMRESASKYGYLCRYKTIYYLCRAGKYVEARKMYMEMNVLDKVGIRGIVIFAVISGFEVGDILYRSLDIVARISGVIKRIYCREHK
jgi:glycosyltransferase involved in cell wall biosynthesis